MLYNHKHVEWSSVHVPENVSPHGTSCQGFLCAPLSRKATSGVVSSCGSMWLLLKSPVYDIKVCTSIFFSLQKESGEEVEVEEFYVKYKNL